MVSWQHSTYQRLILIESSKILQYVKDTIHHLRHYRTEVENDDVYKENYSQLHRTPFLLMDFVVCSVVTLPKPHYSLIKLQNYNEGINRNSFLNKSLFKK